MKYKEFVKNIDKKILKWNYAIPLGFLAYLLSNLFGGSNTIIGRAIGVFNILVFVGIITGAIDLIKYVFLKKNEK